MTTKTVKRAIVITVLVALVPLAGCGGNGSASKGTASSGISSGGSGTASGNISTGESGTTSTSSTAPGLIISGVVYDISTSSAPPLAGATVTLRGVDNTALLSTTTSTDGSYILVNVPASTDMYLDVGKSSYANFNDEIINITTSWYGKQLWIAAAENTQYTADLITGHTGTTATWSDSFYSSQSWFALDIYDSSGTEVPGISVSASPSGPTVLYNNGFNVFIDSAGPTASPGTDAYANLLGGYGPATGIYSFILTSATETKTLKVPLVQGEMTYLAIYPW